jgi:diaminohydroxyphosphoribosylaminopyrimidine deaminase/5-amino-6-(5-phosphoribosylamino)uracil reductase
MIDWNLMSKAIELANKSIPEDQRPHPNVGALLADREGNVVATAFRGQYGRGDHAEFLLLEKAKEAGHDLAELTLFTTLEPCTSRSHRKKPCAKRVCESGVRTVVIGMVDPNPQMRGLGILWLQASGINVHLAPTKYFQEIEKNNKRFIRQFLDAA